MATDVRRWAEQFRQASDDDETIGAMRKYFTCSYLLDMHEVRAIVRMQDGKVADIDVNPASLDAYDFAIRASPETWRKFATPVPPPMFHGLWAASFRAGMKLEGNITVMMQNLRNLTAQLELLRKTGVPV